MRRIKKERITIDIAMFKRSKDCLAQRDFAVEKQTKKKLFFNLVCSVSICLVNELCFHVCMRTSFTFSFRLLNTNKPKTDLKLKKKKRDFLDWIYLI